MADRFIGAWLVTEYVFNPDGVFAGIIRQQRTLQSSCNGQLTVTQVCEPAKGLNDHPMGAFAGEWVFEMTVDGSLRDYRGPDVVGIGTEWSPGAMTSRGVWPRFGYAYEGYSVLVKPDRQMTGGFFSLAGRSVADIVGVAVPSPTGSQVSPVLSANDGAWPHLDLAATPPVVDVEGPSLTRRVGPLQVTQCWPTAQQPQRVLSLSDPISGRWLTIRMTARPQQAVVETYSS